ncbi:hypothetical protein FQN57_003963 [Myotisia sp. PD_48]|nr:hypothetical protein FQN57_003963 [Myotisia sp. PD_48]
MLALRNILRAPLKALRHPYWGPSRAIAPLLDSSQLVEEELSPYYDPNHFYPAKLGEVLNGRYQLATKVGHGSRSTVWLARDINQWRFLKERYVTVKINSNNYHLHKTSSDFEVDILRRILGANTQHQGWKYVRKPLDIFSIEGIAGRSHICFIFEPLREPLPLYCWRYETEAIPRRLLKLMIQMTLHGLDYLHFECHIIHTDLKPGNMLLKLEKKSLLVDDARDEFENPLPQKHCEDGRTIYLSRNDYGRPIEGSGGIEIIDFDTSVWGNIPQSGCIQTEVYRAPEVILDTGFTYSADIWSLGVMLWDLLEGHTLFQGVDPLKIDGYDDQKHLAYITSLLGQPPKDLLMKGKRTSMFYDPDGTLKGPKDQIPKDFTFENSLSTIEGQEKEMFLAFVRRMVRWKPEERSTAQELLTDPWLHEEFR